MNVEVPYNEEWLITHYNTTVSTAITSSEYRADECYQVVEDYKKEIVRAEKIHRTLLYHIIYTFLR